MASYINRGESVFFQFRNGKSVLSSQSKPRMFKTAEKATLGLNYVDTDDIVEYAEQKHGEWAYIGGDEWCCTNCGEVISTEGRWERPSYNYCHECGAKMDGDSHEA